MFTGIIQTLGTLVSIDKKGDWILRVRAPEIAANVPEGASVAHNGICLTIISKDSECFEVQASGETISRTTLGTWGEGRMLNLERALRMGDELGGHIVTGHVDGVATVVERKAEGESVRFTFEVPEAFARFIAPKGSVALDGVSLTVNEVQGARFGVNIIPYTQEKTTLGRLQASDAVNFEVDTLARYVARMNEVDHG